MFESYERELKPWVIYYYVSPGFRCCMARFQSRADGEIYLGSVKKQIPEKLYPKLVFDLDSESGVFHYE